MLYLLSRVIKMSDNNKKVYMDEMLYRLGLQDIKQTKIQKIIYNYWEFEKLPLYTLKTVPQALRVSDYIAEQPIPSPNHLYINAENSISQHSGVKELEKFEFKRSEVIVNSYIYEGESYYYTQDFVGDQLSFKIDFSSIFCFSQDLEKLITKLNQNEISKPSTPNLKRPQKDVSTDKPKKRTKNINKHKMRELSL